MSENRYVRTLQQAVQIAGGLEKLAELLRTSPEILAKWLSGEIAPSIKPYLAAVEMVSRSARAKARQMAR